MLQEEDDIKCADAITKFEKLLAAGCIRKKQFFSFFSCGTSSLYLLTILLHSMIHIMPAITFRSYAMVHSVEHFRNTTNGMIRSCPPISPSGRGTVVPLACPTRPTTVEKEHDDMVKKAVDTRPSSYVDQLQQQQTSTRRRRRVVHFEEANNVYHDNTTTMTKEERKQELWYNRQNYATFKHNVANDLVSLSRNRTYYSWAKRVTNAYEAYAFVTTPQEVRNIRQRDIQSSTTKQGQPQSVLYPIELVGLEKLIVFALHGSTDVPRHQMYREIRYCQQAQHSKSQCGDEDDRILLYRQISRRASQQSKLWAQHIARLAAVTAATAATPQ
jgi:hypothetical protein